MHMLDATLRMLDGEMPHLDFMTPIGVLGFAPVAGFLALGFTVGKATLLANAAVLAVMLPAVWWISATRFSKGQAYYFGAIMVFTLMAVVYGGGSSSISLSMYYNRWAWGLAYIVLAVVLFAPRRELGERWVAPLTIGLGMAALLMLKMTFFVPLALAVTLILLAQKQARLLLHAVLVGAVAGGILVAWLGVDFFWAYMQDLLAITRTASGRVNAGTDFSVVVASPHTLASTLILFAALIMFRKSGRMNQGLVMLILAPAFAYITYQNWGNDPKWLHLVILYIWANLPEEDERTAFDLPARQSGIALIVAAFTFIFPSIFAMATTPFRVLAATTEDYLPLPINGGVSDIWLTEGHVNKLVVMRGLEGRAPMTDDAEPTVIDGFTYPDCRVSNELVAQFVGMAEQVEALDFARGKPVITADVLNVSWMLGDVGRVHGAAPWYYGDDSGIDEAAFLMVPLCAVKQSLRAAMVSQFQDANYGLEEVYRSDLMVLYEVSKPAE